MRDKILFKDIPIGGMFAAYGNVYGNYDYPKVMDLKKISDTEATEYIDGKPASTFIFNPEDGIYENWE